MMSAAAVRDVPARSRYELDAGNGVTAVANYTLADGAMTLTHTETPLQARGQGIASQLVRGVLEDVRSRGLKVVPRCAFVRAYMIRHPDFHDLLAVK
jgi:uncharacterized protein